MPARPYHLVAFSFLLLVISIVLIQCRVDSRQDPTEVTVLCYHRVGDHDAREAYSVTDAQLRDHLAVLQGNGYRFIGLDDFLSWRRGDRPLSGKPVMLTFDDANLSDYETVFPLLRSDGLKACFFLSADSLGQNGRLDKNQVREMWQSTLCSFGSHSATHRNLVSLQPDILRHEVVDSKERIENFTGSAVQAFAYPSGFWDKPTRQALEEHGYALAFTVLPGRNTRTTDPFALRRIVVRSEYTSETLLRMMEMDRSAYEPYYRQLMEKALKSGFSEIVKVCQTELQEQADTFR